MPSTTHAGWPSGCDNDGMRVGVLAPMPMELKPFATALGLERDGDLSRGTLAGHEVVATITGVGMTRAAAATERLLAIGVDRVIVIGIAGGVDTALPIGTVVTPEVIVDGAQGTEYRLPAWSPVTPQRRIVTYDDFDVEIQVMGRLQEEGYAAVDMETAAVAAVCEREGVAYSVFRAISDNATDGSVDSAIAGMLHPDGTPDARAALLYMLRRPWRIPRMARLGRDSQRAAQAAADAAIAALRALPQPAD